MNVQVGISGSRDFHDKEYLSRIISDYSPRNLACFVVGDAAGVDTTVSQICEARGVVCHVKEAEWSEYGKSAGPRRNQKIVDLSDMLLAFPGPLSKGTWDTIHKAMEKGIPVYIFEVSE